MSWSATAVGKPSEIAGKIAGQLASSRSQSGHAEVFDAIESAVAASVKGVPDEQTGSYPAIKNVVVETSGHIDQHAATVTLSIRTITEYQKPAAA
jgi:hypothetical protein